MIKKFKSFLLNENKAFNQIELIDDSLIELSDNGILEKKIILFEEGGGGKEKDLILLYSIKYDTEIAELRMLLDDLEVAEKRSGLKCKLNINQNKVYFILDIDEKLKKFAKSSTVEYEYGFLTYLSEGYIHMDEDVVIENNFVLFKGYLCIENQTEEQVKSSIEELKNLGAIDIVVNKPVPHQYPVLTFKFKL